MRRQGRAGRPQQVSLRALEPRVLAVAAGGWRFLQANAPSLGRVFHKMLYQAPSPQRKKDSAPKENKLRLFLKRSSEPLLNLQNAAQQVGNRHTKPRSARILLKVDLFSLVVLIDLNAQIPAVLG